MASSLFSLCVQGGASEPVVGSTPDGPLRLYYFDVFGRGGVIRQALRLGGVPFEDCRVTDWPARKHDMPFGQMPVLEVGNVKLAESSAIVHYVGRLSGLMPSNALQQSQVQSIVVSLADLHAKMYKEWGSLPSGGEKDRKAEHFRRDILPTYYRQLETYVSQTATNGYAVGGTLSVADLMIHNELQILSDPTAELALPCDLEKDCGLNLQALRASAARAAHALRAAGLLGPVKLEQRPL